MFRFTICTSLLVALCQCTPAPDSDDTFGSDLTCFGDSIPADAPRHTLDACALALADSGAASGVYTGTVVASCQALGCWMEVTGSATDTFPVFMKDHAFFLPVDSLRGRRVCFHGEAFLDSFSTKTSQWAFQATGVLIEGYGNHAQDLESSP